MFGFAVFKIALVIIIGLETSLHLYSYRFCLSLRFLRPLFGLKNPKTILVNKNLQLVS